MQTLSIWIIVGVISYIATMWIKSFIWNIVASTIVWYVSVYYIKKYLKGEI